MNLYLQNNSIWICGVNSYLIFYDYFDYENVEITLFNYTYVKLKKYFDPRDEITLFYTNTFE